MRKSDTGEETPTVRGVRLDSETRCEHWSSELDVVAIRMFCCGEYFACRDCHAAVAGHPLVPWPADRFGEKAVLCGVCRLEMTIVEYLACGFRCPRCAAAFNPGCSLHYRDYFDIAG